MCQFVVHNYVISQTSMNYHNLSISVEPKICSTISFDQMISVSGQQLKSPDLVLKSANACLVVVAQWWEHWWLKPVPLGSIPSDYQHFSLSSFGLTIQNLAFNVISIHLLLLPWQHLEMSVSVLLVESLCDDVMHYEVVYLHRDLLHSH